MDKKSTFMIVGILAVAVIVFVVVSFQRSSLNTEDQLSLATTTAWQDAPAEPPEIMLSPSTVVTAKHAYRNGAHIVAGEVPLLSPCHVLESNGVASADLKSVLIQLISSVKTGETCAEMITPARFKVTIKAEKNATIAATLNGQSITLNLIEAGPTEDLDNFELYIKG